MVGKVCLVTGGTSGVGRAVARGLARLGAEVVIVSRDSSRGEEAVRAIREESGNQNVRSLHADLADLASVRRAAAAFRGEHERLDVLAETAGIISWRRRMSVDGHELVFATNHLAHALLATELLELMQRTGASRLLSVAGGPGLLERARLDIAELAERRSGYSPVRVAIQTMLARVVWTMEAARRWKERGITANVFYPGAVRSRLDRGLPLPLRVPASVAMLLLSRECPTGVRACASPEMEGVSGRFIVGKRFREFSNPGSGTETADQLWSLTERLLSVPG